MSVVLVTFAGAPKVSEEAIEAVSPECTIVRLTRAVSAESAYSTCHNGSLL